MTGLEVFSLLRTLNSRLAEVEVAVRGCSARCAVGRKGFDCLVVIWGLAGS